MMVLPSGVDSVQEQGKFYGAAHLLVRDAAGNELLSQTIHNRLLDTGENFINSQVFTDGVVVADPAQMSAICVSDQNTVLETDTATSIAAANGLTGTPGNHCHFTVPSVNADGTVVLGSEQFVGGTDINATEIINSIAICSNNGGADYAECDTAASPLAFAAIVTSAVQLGNTETVDITYTFDISSLNS